MNACLIQHCLKPALAFYTMYYENETFKITIVPSATLSGLRTAVLFFSKQSTSGPCGVIMLWRLAPPGWKPSSFAS